MADWVPQKGAGPHVPAGSWGAVGLARASQRNRYPVTRYLALRLGALACGGYYEPESPGPESPDQENPSPESADSEASDPESADDLAVTPVDGGVVSDPGADDIAIEIHIPVDALNQPDTAFGTHS